MTDTRVRPPPVEGPRLKWLPGRPDNHRVGRLSASGRKRAAQVSRALGLAVWTTLLVGGAVIVAVHAVTRDAGAAQAVVTPLINLFFVLAVVWLTMLAVCQRAARGGLLILLAGIVLWAAGSVTINNGDGLAAASFPSVSEFFFFPAYVALAVHLLWGARRRSSDPDARWRATSTVWLEAAVIVGGVLSIAGLVLASPARLGFDSPGPLFLIASYPLLLDLVLAALFLAQAALGLRALSWRGMLPFAGFIALAVADLGTLLSFEDGTYNSAPLFVVSYGVGFAFIVSGAAVRSTPTRPREGETVPLQLAAAAVATAALVVRPADAGQWYVTVPAVLTLVAAGARLVMALTEARAAGEARRLSLTDELTGLPNRAAVLADVDESLRGQRPVGLLILDIDNFKEVNDSLGHVAGDALLCHVAAELGRVIGGRGRVFRLGGDEFAVVVPRDHESSLLELAHTLRDELLEPVTMQGISLSLRTSLGVTGGRLADSRAGDVLRRAEIALFEAKRSRTGAALYDPARDDFSTDRLRLVNELRVAIGEGQLRPWFQPQVDAASGRVVGMEALVRWHHPDRGVLAPIHFLGDARQAGLMAALTDRLMDDVVHQARRWRQQGLDVRVSFNCAPPELLGAALVPRLRKAVANAGLPPGAILVEVTEDSFVASPQLARETLLTLRDEGVEVAIDDYGTGFSSLAYLRDLPVSELKIDRSFVKDLTSDSRDHVIVESTCRLAHAMGLRVVAEGVEDEVTATMLRAIGIDVLQGYFVAKPMPAADVAAWARAWDPRVISAGLAAGVSS